MNDKKRSLRGDIVMSVPWSCADRDCPAGWHMSDYWLYEDGTYAVANHGDGDHEDCELEDVPSYADYLQATIDYAWWVHDNERDPLNLFGVPVKVKRKVVCVARFIGTLSGAAYLVSLHVSGRAVPHWMVPDDAREYLDIVGRQLTGEQHAGAVHRTALTWAELIAVPGVKVKGDFAMVRFTVDRESSRADTTVERELRRAARQRIAELEQEKQRTAG